MNKPKMLILDDCKRLLRKLQVAITKYEVIPATTLDEATKLMDTKDVSFIVADILLKDGKNGHHLFEELFSRGRLVPGVVMTAIVMNQSVRTELSYIGVTEVIPKGMGDLDVKIEGIADRILTDERKQLAQLANKVKNLELWDAPCGERGSVKDVLNHILDGNCSDEERKSILDEIVRKCNRTSRLDDRDYPFPEIGYVEE